MGSLTTGARAHLTCPTQLQIIAFLAKMQAKAANGEPATVLAWWGGLPPFYPNPDVGAA